MRRFVASADPDGRATAYIRAGAVRPTGAGPSPVNEGWHRLLPVLPPPMEQSLVLLPSINSDRSSALIDEVVRQMRYRTVTSIIV